LERIGAPTGIRLAYQVRPTSDVSVVPLVPVERPLDGLRVDLAEGRELMITALYADLRDSTQLAAGRLPFDAIFIFDRYIQATTAAILVHGGHVTLCNSRPPLCARASCQPAYPAPGRRSRGRVHGLDRVTHLQSR
jgi:hypothetical protein